ncbi:MAG: hypothetical protein Unbinned6486contig1001_36 [Prokaryotic dsDNA virus sp.]|nr:MAG: hypothetical protein Unbinned6486contig1001_36 [Prokaryotic dsDNA virus sp.]|tara:strand:+ start:8895 stop:9668 length:774 start_codon:yes stop_codon:yes gene_type:complete
MEYSFNTEHAKKYGVNEAIMIKNFQFWIKKNVANKYSLHDNRTWTYNSTKAFQELFTFWSVGQIKRILKSLVEQNVLMVGNYNKLKYDRTKWYAFVDESLFVCNDKTISRNQPMDSLKTTNAIAENSQPIPYSKTTYSKTDSKNILYKDMIVIYDNFCQMTFYAPAKINGLEGKSMKQIILYLKNVCKAKGNDSDDSVKDAFTYILSHWDKLDSFYQKQIKLAQINSNLTNIINQIKNGSQKSSSSSIAQEILAKYQ